MAGPLVIPTGVQVRLIWQQAGTDAAVNVVGALNPTALTINQTLTNTVGTAIKSLFTSSGLKALTSSQWTLSKIGLRDINVASQAEWLDTGTGIAGTGSAEALPPNVAYCVTVRTALAGKRYRGRFYVVGADEAQNITTGLPISTYTTACAAFVFGIQGALSTSGLQMAVLSRVNLTGTPTTTAVARRNFWNTQRRRLIPGI